MEKLRKYITPGKLNIQMSKTIKLKKDSYLKKNITDIIIEKNKVNTINLSKEKNRNIKLFLEPIKKVKPFNLNTLKTCKNAKINKSINDSKEIIDDMMNKLEKIYKETLENSQKIKIDVLPFNSDNNQDDIIDILKQEIKYLKIKNELIKLKSNFQEIIFYSIKHIIEDSKKDIFLDDDIYKYINQFHNKILCVLTQNNQKFYDNLKVLDFENKNNILFTFNLKEDKNIIDKINQKKFNTLNNIEENIHKIIKDIDNIISNNDKNYDFNNNKIDPDFKLKINTFKLNLLSTSNIITSYYLLSDNFNYSFKLQSKFNIFNPENIVDNQINQRVNKIKDNWEKIINPLIKNKLRPINEKELNDFIMNLSLFYENMNKNIILENNLIRINSEINKEKLNSSINSLKLFIENYINQNNEGFSNLSKLCNLVTDNKNKKSNNSIIAYIYKEKESINNIINSFNSLKKEFSENIIKL